MKTEDRNEGRNKSKEIKEKKKLVARMKEAAWKMRKCELKERQ